MDELSIVSACAHDNEDISSVNPLDGHRLKVSVIIIQHGGGGEEDRMSWVRKSDLSLIAMTFRLFLVRPPLGKKPF